MPSGTATRCQSLLNFNRQSREDNIETNDSQTIHQHPKRLRTDLEVPEITVAMDGPSHDQPFNSASNTTVIHAIRDDGEERTKCVRLDRLRNKADRYESHIAFLKDCIAIKRIPKGLVIDLEPSIGNNDEDFCVKWYQRLEDFSTTLMKDIVEYSEKIKKESLEKIKSEQEDLRKLMKADDYKEVCEVMDQNSSDRKQTLQTTKRKKFNYLKYHRETPMQKRSGQRSNDRRNTPEHTAPADTKYTDRSQNDWRKKQDNNRYSGNNGNNTNYNRTKVLNGPINNQRGTKSYRDALTSKSNTNVIQKESGHFLRRTSRTNLSRKNSWNEVSNYQQNGRWNQREDSKDKEIRELQEKIATLETSNTRQGESSKKEQSPDHGGTKNKYK